MLVVAVLSPLLQAYVTPPVAVKSMLVVVHVSSVANGVSIPAVGAVICWVMMKLSSSVQPLVEVTVTVYVPGSVMLVVAVLSPLFQAYILPPVAVKSILVIVHVSSVAVGVSIPAVGTVISWVMMMLSSSVHPLLEVTVTV